MDKADFLSELSTIVVANNWDLPTPGRELDLQNNFGGPDKDVREAMKTEGRKRAKSSDSEQRLIGYGLEAYGHYFLSLESATNQHRKHPDTFVEYFPHWLYSDPDRLPADIFSILSDWFPKPITIRIKKGGMHWRYRA